LINSIRHINQEQKNHVVLYLKGNLDISISTLIEEKVLEIIEKESEKHIVLNFQLADRVVSSSLHMLMTIKDQLKASQRKLLLCNVNEEVENVLKVIDIIKNFDIFNSEEDAVSSIFS